MTNDVLNMSRAWDKENIWVPDRISESPTGFEPMTLQLSG